MAVLQKINRDTIMGLFDFLKGRNKTNQGAPAANGPVTPANLETPTDGGASVPTQPTAPLPPQNNTPSVPPAEKSDEPKA